MTCRTTREFIRAAENDFAVMNIPVSGEQVQSSTGPVNAQFRHFERETLTHSEGQLVTAVLNARANMMRLKLEPTLCEGRYLVTTMERRITGHAAASLDATREVQRKTAAEAKALAEFHGGQYDPRPPTEWLDGTTGGTLER